MLHYEAIEPGTLAILKSFMKLEEFHDFYLVDGSALALQIGHRLSVDIDLFIPGDIHTDRARETLKTCFRVSITGEFHNTFNVLLDGIKTDLISFKYPLLENIIEQDGIRMAGLPDISAMKLSALAQRGSKKDFFDLYFLLKEYSLEELFGFFRKKFSATELFHITKSLTWFEDAEAEPDPVLIRKTEWKEVKAFLRKTVRTM